MRIPRARPPFYGYNGKVDSFNSYITKAFTNAPTAGVWRHRGLSHPSINIYLPYSVHLNAQPFIEVIEGQPWSLYVANRDIYTPCSLYRS